MSYANIVKKNLVNDNEINEVDLSDIVEEEKKEEKLEEKKEEDKLTKEEIMMLRKFVLKKPINHPVKEHVDTKNIPCIAFLIKKMMHHKEHYTADMFDKIYKVRKYLIDREVISGYGQNYLDIYKFRSLIIENNGVKEIYDFYISTLKKFVDNKVLIECNNDICVRKYCSFYHK